MFKQLKAYLFNLSFALGFIAIVSNPVLPPANTNSDCGEIGSGQCTTILDQ